MAWYAGLDLNANICAHCNEELAQHLGVANTRTRTLCPKGGHWVDPPTGLLIAPAVPAAPVIPPGALNIFMGSNNTKAPPAPEPPGGWMMDSRKQLDVCAECGGIWKTHRRNACPGQGGRLWADSVPTKIPFGGWAVEVEAAPDWKVKTLAVKDDRWPHKCYGCGGPAYVGLRCHCKRSCRPEFEAS